MEYSKYSDFFSFTLMMSKFKYLGGIIPFTFVIVLIVISIVVFLFSRPTCCGKKQVIPVGDGKEFSLWQRFCYGHPYECVYESSWKNLLGDDISMYLLLLWRVACFCYFFGIVFLWNYSLSGGDNAHYFTLWNIDLISAYYFLAMIASIIGVFNHKGYLQQKDSHLENSSYWSQPLTQFGYSIQILYEITGSTAFFVTVVAFGSLNPHFVFWNVNDHFMTSMSILVEIFLNRMIVRWEHLIFTILWALMYLIFIWPLVAMGDLSDWPYFFLATDTATVFPWYIGLVVILILFYFVLWLIVWLKELLIESLESKYLVVNANSPTKRLNERDVELQHAEEPESLQSNVL